MQRPKSRQHWYSVGVNCLFGPRNSASKDDDYVGAEAIGEVGLGLSCTNYSSSKFLFM